MIKKIRQTIGTNAMNKLRFSYQSVLWYLLNPTLENLTQNSPKNDITQKIGKFKIFSAVSQV
jgi:hypothetical protein